MIIDRTYGDFKVILLNATYNFKTYCMTLISYLSCAE